MRRPRRRLFVEGGGDSNSSLRTECRRAFAKLLEAAGVRNKPRIVACGSRGAAWKQFRQTIDEGADQAWLLVDSEGRVTTPDPWEHVGAQDGWQQPSEATRAQLHLMVVCMEAWLCSDPDAFAAVLRTADVQKLPPPGAGLESVDKDRLFQHMKRATRSTSDRKGSKSGGYSKGSHSFRVLERVRPEPLSALPWARRFLDAMKAAGD